MLHLLDGAAYLHSIHTFKDQGVVFSVEIGVW